MKNYKRIEPELIYLYFKNEADYRRSILLGNLFIWFMFLVLVAFLYFNF